MSGLFLQRQIKVLTKKGSSHINQYNDQRFVGGCLEVITDDPILEVTEYLIALAICHH